MILRLKRETFERLLAFGREIGRSPVNCAQSLLEDLIADPEFECSAFDSLETP